MFNQIMAQQGPRGKQLQQLNLCQASYIVTHDTYSARKQIQIFSKLGDSLIYNRFFPIPQPKSDIFDSLLKRKKKDDEEFIVKTQKKDRNVTSNLIHHMVKYMRNGKHQNCQQIKQIIKRRKLRLTIEEFYEILENIAARLKTYVTIGLVKQIWFDESHEKRQFCLVMRIMSRNFYKRNGFLSIFFSNKFNIESKNSHYKALRTVLSTLSRKQGQINFNM